MWCFNDILIVSQDLQLEYVHGYRGFDSRNNLHYINDGADIVFHAAGAGIVQNLSTGNRSAYCLTRNELHTYRTYCNLHCVIKKSSLMTETRRKWCIPRVLIQHACHAHFAGLFDTECLVTRHFLSFKLHNVGIHKVYLEKSMALLLMFQETKVSTWSTQMTSYV